MFTSLLVAAALTCKPYMPPQPPPSQWMTEACEGSDRVTRNHDGYEVRRVPGVCVAVTRCEGADRVRRNQWGAEVSRQVNACTVASCESGDKVVRTYGGVELSRVYGACVFIPRPVPVPRPVQPDVMRFGLSYR